MARIAGARLVKSQRTTSISNRVRKKPDAEMRTSYIFPGFLDSYSLTVFLFLHPSHGFLDRFEIIARLLRAFISPLLEEFELCLEGLKVVDGWNGTRRVPDE